MARRRSATLAALLLVATLAGAGTAVAPAGAVVVAVEEQSSSPPVLWQEGLAWEDDTGVFAATPGSTPRRLAPLRGIPGYTLFSIDGGEGTGASAGPLAFGWLTDYSPPPSSHAPPPPPPQGGRGVIAADGRVTALPSCGGLDYHVSISAASVGYICEGVPPGAQAPAYTPSYLALGDPAAQGSPARVLPYLFPFAGPFQVSGDYAAYYLSESFYQPGRSPAWHVLVEDQRSASASYEVPEALAGEHSSWLSLQEDGTLVVMSPSAACSTPGGAANGLFLYAAAWYSPASPLAHPIGCLAPAAPRPVGGRMIALVQGPGGTVSLSLVDIATGSARTLALLPNAHLFAGADFDGRRLAWGQLGCAGEVLQYAPDVSSLSPASSGPAPPARCPVLFHLHGTLRPDARGVLRLAVSCPAGCLDVGLAIAAPAPLAAEAASFFSLQASPATSTRSLRLSRRQLTYLRRQRRVRVTLTAFAVGYGQGATASTRTTVHALLTR